MIALCLKKTWAENIKICNKMQKTKH